MKTCTDCRFASVKGAKFECRRFAPSPLIPQDSEDSKPKAVWPVVKADNWCGQWALGEPRP